MLFPKKKLFKKSLDSLPGVQWVLDSRMLLSDTSDNAQCGRPRQFTFAGLFIITDIGRKSTEPKIE